MGRAHALITSALRDRLCEDDTLAAQVWIMEDSDHGDGVRYVLLSSAALPTGYNGVQAISIDGESIRFRRDVDT